MDPATAKECKGPCLYWCKPKSTVLPFLLGVAVGAFLMHCVVPFLKQRTAAREESKKAKL